MKRIVTLLLSVVLFSLTAFAQSPEFSEPWKNREVALAIDPFEGNDIDWDLLATDTRVVAIIHRATIGDRADGNMPSARLKRSSAATSGVLIIWESPATRSSRRISFSTP